jgi:hypothetical protein
MTTEQNATSADLRAAIPEQPLSAIASKLDNIETTYEKKLEEIQNELEDTFNIKHEYLIDENIKTVSKLHYWITKHAYERRFLVKISRKRNYVYSSLYEDYREGKNGRGNITLNKDGIEAYVTKNSEYIYWNSLMEEQKNIVDYIDQICWALKQTKMQALKNIQEQQRVEGS